MNGHPDPSEERYCAAICAAYAHGAQIAGWTVSCLNSNDWPAIEPGPLRRLTAAHAMLSRANGVAIVFPLWLGDAPAPLRALFEEWPFGLGELRPLASLRTIVTMDMPAFLYRPARQGRLRCKAPALLQFPHVEGGQYSFIGSVGSRSANKRIGWLAETTANAACDAKRAEQSMRRAALLQHFAPIVRYLRGWPNSSYKHQKSVDRI